MNTKLASTITAAMLGLTVTAAAHADVRAIYRDHPSDTAICIVSPQGLQETPPTAAYCLNIPVHHFYMPTPGLMVTPGTQPDPLPGDIPVMPAPTKSAQ